MNSGVKTGLILLLLAGVVFGVTVIGSYTGGGPAVDPGGGDETGGAGGPPLVFPLDGVGYEPTAADAEGINWGQYKRAFNGFLEVGPELNTQSFWFQQPAGRTVRVGVRGRSCSACTSARIGTLPADPLAAYVRHVKEGRVPPPVGPAEALTASLIAAGVAVDQQVQWQEFDFDHPDRAVTLPPPAASGPLTGLFQMIYKVTGLGPKKLDAYLALESDGGTASQMNFSVTTQGMPAFLLLPVAGKLDLKDLPEGSSPRTTEVVCWSATRRRTGTGRTLPPPAAVLSPRDPFIEVGTAVPVPDDELYKVAASLEQDKVQPPVLGAYKVPVTVHRTRPANAPPATPPEPDVGQYDRQLALTVPGEQSAQVLAVTGTVSGLVSLEGAASVDLGSFASGTGSPDRNFVLRSDKPGLKLSVAAAECKPKYVGVKLGEPEDGAGRRRWRLTVGVAPGVALEEFPADSVIVLLADTGDGTPRRVKLPLRGRAFVRGNR